MPPAERELTEDETDDAMELRAKGVPIGWIADDLECTAASVHRAIRRRMRQQQEGASG